MTDLNLLPAAARDLVTTREELAAVRAREEELRAAMERAVVEARRARMTWDEIAECTGYANRGTVSRMFGHLVHEAGIGSRGQLLA